MIQCPYCNATEIRTCGKRYIKTTNTHKQRYRCKICKKRFVECKETNVKLNNSQEQIKTEYSKFDGILESKSVRIKTLNELLEYCKVDLTKWEVERHIINKWEVGMSNPEDSKTPIVEPLWQVKVWLKPKTISLKDDLTEILNDIKKFAPKYPKITYKRHNEHLMFEIDIMDVHYGMLSWAKETGERQDIRIINSIYVNTIDKLLSRIQGIPVEKILFPVGNDFFHIDNSENSTQKGTMQDTDTRWQKSFSEARTMLVKVIDTLVQIAPVEIPIIVGNHDWERMYYMGEVLDSWYRNQLLVDIDNRPQSRKYISYGKNLIGFTHGNEEKIDSLPLIMAQERPKEWGNAIFKEWHIGHTHSKKENKYIAGNTYNGVSIKTISALTATDAWHYKRGYVKDIRAGEAFLWDETEGCVGHYQSNIVESY